MNIHTIKRVLLVLSFLLFFQCNCEAALRWDWTFATNNITTNGTTDVTMTGTLCNNSTASETIGNFASLADYYIDSVAGEAIAGYTLDFGPTKNSSSTDFFNQFGTPLDAGFCMGFTFGIYDPAATAPNGVYTALDNESPTYGQDIGLKLRSDNSDQGSIFRCFSWTVE